MGTRSEFRRPGGAARTAVNDRGALAACVRRPGARWLGGHLLAQLLLASRHLLAEFLELLR